MTNRAQTLPAEAALPPCDERLVALYSYWISIHPARRVLPARQHFDPVAIPQLLSWIWLVEFQRHPLRFRYRLVGTEHVRALGRDATGEWLDEVHPRFKQSSGYPQFIQAAAGAKFGFFKGAAVQYEKRDWMSLERLILPLARDGSEVDMLLGITIFTPRSSTLLCSSRTTMAAS